MFLTKLSNLRRRSTVTYNLREEGVEEGQLILSERMQSSVRDLHAQDKFEKLNESLAEDEDSDSDEVITVQ